LAEAWSAIRPAGRAEAYGTVEAHQGFGAIAAELQMDYAGQGWSA
jgi:hypothetical protein